MTELENAMQVLLAEFEARWKRRKPTELRELWHPDERDPYYIAEEIAAPMYGWEAIEAYWAQAEEILVSFSIRTFDVRCKLVADRLAALHFTMHWNGIVRGMEHAPLGLDVRVSALVRECADSWRFCHYVESPLGALPYLLASYGANVDPGFLDG